MGRPRGRGWRALGLGTKLQLVLALVAASVVLVAMLGYVRLIDFEHGMIDLYERRVVPLRELKSVSDRHAIDVVDTVHKVSAGRMLAADGEQILATALVAIDLAWQKYTASRTTPDDLALIAQTAPLLAEARDAVTHARALMHDNDLEGLEQLRKGPMYRKIEPLTRRLSELVDVQVRATDTLVRSANLKLRAARRTTTLALLLTAGLALVVAFVFSRRLAASVGAIGKVVRAAATGDLTQRVSLAGGDELADMAADIDEMVRSLDASRQNIEAHAHALEVSERAARMANSAKSAFLSSMSHELRTPLNVVLGYTQLMLREPKRHAEEQRELRSIMEAGNHLLTLIDDVLSISKIETGQLSLRPATFAPRKLLAAIVTMLSLRASAKQLAIESACTATVPEHVEGDESKLRQVVVNLLGNAIKFTATGRVSVTMDYQGNDRLQISVSDTGPGIAAAEQARLFESFFQGQHGQASAEGTGLGLYISQSLVRLMGGAIQVRSQPGEGTEFSFSVLAPARGVPATSGRSYGFARLPAGITIAPMLVVDDRETNRDVLTRLLRRLGAEVIEAKNGAEALARWSEQAFSLVWMDLQMPTVDGLTALAQLRAQETDAGRTRTRVVAITASVIDFDREAALRAGFDDLVGKPFLDETVYRTVEVLLGIALEAVSETTSVGVPAQNVDVHLQAFSPAQRRRLLDHLVRGEMDDALRVTDEVGEGVARTSLRSVVEGFQVELLIGALRASNLV